MRGVPRFGHGPTVVEAEARKENIARNQEMVRKVFEGKVSPANDFKVNERRREHRRLGC